MELTDEEFQSVYSYAEYFSIQIYGSLKKGGDLKGLLYEIVDRIHEEIPTEFHKAVLDATDKHLDNPELVFPMLVDDFSSEDEKLDWQGAKAKLHRMMR
ncbi:hypothetical protein [Selenomonas ruminantium]|uniref:hypothetical protein n=1 Tax=Selenomonas ruminantium TaxID=971 RepID=UPI0005A53FC5|nr:hypothetical protein [Selenomonas ruminantium]